MGLFFIFQKLSDTSNFNSPHWLFFQIFASFCKDIDILSLKSYHCVIKDEKRCSELYFIVSALNQEYFHRVQISNHFIQGSDSAAETVFLYLAQNSGGDIDKAVEFLAENPEDEYCRANCADAVLSRISPSSSETYWVSYSFLSADILEDGVLKEDAEFGPVAGKLIDNRNLLVSSDSYQPYDCQRSGFAVGVIGGQALVVAVFVS